MNIVVSHNTKTNAVAGIYLGIDCEAAQKAFDAAVSKPVTEGTLIQWFRRPAMPFKRRFIEATAKPLTKKEQEAKAKADAEEAAAKAKADAEEAAAKAKADAEASDDDLGLGEQK